MFKFAVAILAAVALIGAVGVTAQPCSGSSVDTPGTPMSVSWAFASGELTGTVTTAADKKAATAQTVTIACTGADLTCTSTGEITDCSFDYSEIDGCVTADTSATLTDYDAARQYVLTGKLEWTETYSFCRAAGTAPVMGDRSQEQPFQVTVTVPTQDTATTESIEVHDTWNTGLGVTSVTVTRDDATTGTLDYDFVASVQYPYEVKSVKIGEGEANSGTGGSCESTSGVCTRSFSVSGVSAACDQSGGPLINSVTFEMTIGCSTGGASDCPFKSTETKTVDATVSITVGSFCVQTVDGSFTLTLTSHHPATASTCESAEQDDFYYDDTADAADSICLKATVTDDGDANNFGVTSVTFSTIKVSAGTTTVTGSGTGTTSAEQVVGTKDFGTDLAEPAVDSSTSVTLEAVVDVGYGGSKRRGLLSVASQTLTHTVSLSRGTAGNGAAAAATADNSLVTATSTTSSASTIAIIVGAVAVVSLVAVIAGVAVRRNNQQNAKSVAAMEAALRKANDTAAPKEEVEAASASTTAADSAVSASSSSGEYYYYSYTTASSSV